ncbi:MAG: CARDB domain-containing protein, partial [Chloroflexota bacterium]
PPETTPPATPPPTTPPPETPPATPPVAPPPAPVTRDISTVIDNTGRITQTVTATLTETRADQAVRNTVVTVRQDTVALMPDGRPPTEITIAPATGTIPPPPAGLNVIGIPYDFGPNGVTFTQHPAEITLTLDPATVAGISAGDLTVCYYDQESGSWVGVTVVSVNPDGTVVVQTDHFTIFAILVRVKPAPGTSLTPADLKPTALKISPTRVSTTQTTMITVAVANGGGEAGKYTATLKINGTVEATKEVSVLGGTSKEVSFSSTKAVPGTYTVEVDGLKGSYVVYEPEAVVTPPPSKLPLIIAIIGGLAGIIVIVLIYFWWRRRRYAGPGV